MMNRYIVRPRIGGWGVWDNHALTWETDARGWEKMPDYDAEALAGDLNGRSTH